MDPCVRLARLAVEHYVRFHEPLREVPPDLAAALEGQRAGAFVSIHTRRHELRGCIGTLAPMEASLAREIIRNAIAACSRDARFEPVEPGELGELDIQVDVLGALEPVPDESFLDAKRYAVLVSAGDGRRGVLLPDLEGVGTVQEQVSIACRKARIDPQREPYSLHRIPVVRHRA